MPHQPSAPLTEADRVQAILALMQAHRTRFRESEELLWKLNYAVWGLLVAAGWATTATEENILPALGSWALSIWLVVPLHGWAVYKSMKATRYWRLLSDHYASLAEELMGIAEAAKPRPDMEKGVTFNKHSRHWFVLQMIPTIAAAAIVVLLAW